MLTTRTPAGAPGGARGVPHVPQRRPVRAAQRRHADGRLPRLRRRRRVGRLRVRSRERACSTSTPTRWRGPAASRRPTTERRRPPAVSREVRVCHRDDLKGAPPQIPSLVGRRRSGARDDELRTRHQRQAPAACRASRRCRRTRWRRSSTFLRTGDRRATPGTTRRRSRSEVPLHRLPQVPRSRRLPGDRAAVGHAERDRPEHRRVRVDRSRSASTRSWPRQG